MQAGSLVYVNARIKALENSLLNQMQLTRLMDTETLEDAFKILTECGYGAGVVAENCYQYEKLLKAEEKASVAFLKENAVPKHALECFLIMIDYHNAKAYTKAKYLKLNDASDMVNGEGLIESDNLKDKIFADNYDSFSSFMKEALLAIDYEFSNDNRSPRFIDTALDKATYREIFAVIDKAKCKNTAIGKYFTAKCDFCNMGTFVRCKRLKLDLKFFESGFMEGGSIDESVFVTVYEQSLEIFRDKMKFYGYKDVVNYALEENGLVKFETATDNYLLDLFKRDRNDMFSVSPIAGFYLAKQVEVKVVKLVITAVKNKVDKALLKERLRELYA